MVYVKGKYLLYVYELITLNALLTKSCHKGPFSETFLFEYKIPWPSSRTWEYSDYNNPISR